MIYVCMTVAVTETGDGGVTSYGVTSHVMDAGECRQLLCLNGGTCVINAQQLETCRSVVLYCT